MREISKNGDEGSGSNPSLSSTLTPDISPVLRVEEGAEHPKLAPDSHAGSDGAPLRDTGEPAAQLRRCTEPERDAEGVEWPCGGVLADAALTCSVCQGSRCYVHCGSVDHMGGTLYVEGGAGRWSWRVRQIREGGGDFDMGRWAGHLSYVTDDSRVVVKVRDVEEDDPEEVLRRLTALIPRNVEPPPAAQPRKVAESDCRRRSKEHRAVVAAAHILSAANACPCDGCKAIVRLFNLIVVPAAQAAAQRPQRPVLPAGKAVRS